MTAEQLYTFAQKNSISVYDFGLDSHEALSVMDSDGSCHIAIDRNKISDSKDEKTKLAHELGHCITGSFYNAYSGFDSVKHCENCADKWAIKKIVPEKALFAALSNGYTEPWELAELFSVNEKFIRKAISLYRHGNLYSF